MKKLAPILVALGLALPAWAEEPTMGVMFLDDQGRFQAEAQKRAPLPSGRAVAVGWEQLLRPEAVSRLSYSQRLDLLADPDRLLSSDRAAALFAVERVLLLHPGRDGRVAAEVVDLSGSRSVLTARHDDHDQARGELLALAAGELPESRVAVKANPESHLYHLPDAPHMAPRAEVVDYAHLSEAEGAGYAACTICFPEQDRLLAMDPVDAQLGKYVAARIEAEYRVSDDEAAAERVNRVGRRLLEDNRLPEYRFLVLDSDEINAFAAPTGPLYVTTGLLKVVESDDELAGILGHELAHSERRHARRQFEQSRRMGILGFLATVATGQGWLMAATDLAGTVMGRGYSRGFELEADRDAVLLAFGADYHAEDLVLTMIKFQELEKVRPRTGLGILQSHPGNEERISLINELLVRLEPVREMAARLSTTDPGLAAWLRRNAAACLEDPQDLARFMSAYEALPPVAGVTPSQEEGPAHE